MWRVGLFTKLDLQNQKPLFKSSWIDEVKVILVKNNEINNLLISWQSHVSLLIYFLYWIRNYHRDLGGQN